MDSLPFFGSMVWEDVQRRKKTKWSLIQHGPRQGYSKQLCMAKIERLVYVPPFEEKKIAYLARLLPSTRFDGEGPKNSLHFNDTPAWRWWLGFVHRMGMRGCLQSPQVFFYNQRVSIIPARGTVIAAQSRYGSVLFFIWTGKQVDIAVAVSILSVKQNKRRVYHHFTTTSCWLM